MNPISQQPIDFVLDALFTYVFGNYAFVMLFLLILIILFCMYHNFNLETSFIVILPLLVGLIGVGFANSIFWLLIILVVSFIWIYAIVKLLKI
jgi:hypothetical protein